MTDLDVLEKLQRLAGGRVCLRDRQGLPSGKFMYQWNLYGEKATALMAEMLPWLGERRRKRWDELQAVHRTRARGYGWRRGLVAHNRLRTAAITSSSSRSRRSE